jgi:hypothetical protein
MIDVTRPIEVDLDTLQDLTSVVVPDVLNPAKHLLEVVEKLGKERTMKTPTNRKQKIIMEEQGIALLTIWNVKFRTSLVICNPFSKLHRKFERIFYLARKNFKNLLQLSVIVIIFQIVSA